ncbi:chitobiase/beta-hexosaminidase C-terminal domain-containing protein [Microbispora bryophytorum]|uniref:chitobiase/beta-hexosaminidase C-terminal domain-containing protein n=1 Tax=Microbispora bryophytorum TaxID=1460882 RepID=UPI0033CFE061
MDEPANVYYTLDGSRPNLSSPTPRAAGTPAETPAGALPEPAEALAAPAKTLPEPAGPSGTRQRRPPSPSGGRGPRRP